MSTPNTHYGSEKIERMLDGCKSIFFIGIGGITMSSLAHISNLRGYRTGGSDRTSLPAVSKNAVLKFFTPTMPRTSRITTRWSTPLRSHLKIRNTKTHSGAASPVFRERTILDML